jgi:hypothetical protein
VPLAALGLGSDTGAIVLGPRNQIPRTCITEGQANGRAKRRQWRFGTVS